MGRRVALWLGLRARCRNARLDTVRFGDTDVDRDARRNARRISDTKEVLHQVGDACMRYDVTGGLRDVGL